MSHSIQCGRWANAEGPQWSQSSSERERNSGVSQSAVWVCELVWLSSVGSNGLVVIVLVNVIIVLLYCCRYLIVLGYNF